MNILVTPLAFNITLVGVYDTHTHTMFLIKNDRLLEKNEVLKAIF